MPKNNKISPQKSTAVDNQVSFLSGEDMSDREKIILGEITQKTGFILVKNIWRSNYYGSNQIGAVHYSGKYHGKKSVLKIQGVKPEVSEKFMITSFASQNHSQLIRPPEIFFSLPWQEAKHYEAFIMEEVIGDKVIQSGNLQTRENIAAFFNVYREYRQNCLDQPWLPKAEKPNSEHEFKSIKDVAAKIKPDSPFREKGDLELAEKAIKLLGKIYAKVDLEFIHGHFSCEDLIRQGDQVVLLSNLFWKWRYPFFDAIFAYHWYIYTLAQVEGITPDQIERQRQLWLSEIKKVTSERNIDEKEKLLKAALLERAVAGLLVDSLAYIDENNPVAKYLVDSTREQVRKFYSELVKE
jgi:hypothetical protein